MYTGDTVCYNSCQKRLQDSNKDLDKQFVLTLFYLYVILIKIGGIRMFNRKIFPFHIPDEVNAAIDAIEQAEKTHDSLLDCYLEEFRTTVHQYQDVPGGFSEEDGEEVLHYYYGRHYNH